MDEGLLRNLKLSLKSKHYLMNDLWLRECVEYHISENGVSTQKTIEDFVMSQWLLSDLRELNNENPTLPRNLKQQMKVELTGKYMLQVDSICDVSQSKYSQLQKIRNVSEINIKATAVEAPAWEPKGKRMLQLHLTDGIQDLLGIEYKPILQLKETLLPGFKILIMGPVTCRRGILLLTPSNYKGIGGEVDSLLKTNALENVLARAVGMEENENPYGESNKENNVPEPINTFIEEDDFEIDLHQISQIEMSVKTNEARVQTVSSPVNPSTGRELKYHSESPHRNISQSAAIAEGKKQSGNDRKLTSVVDSQLKPLVAEPSNFIVAKKVLATTAKAGNPACNSTTTNNALAPEVILVDDDDDFDFDQELDRVMHNIDADRNKEPVLHLPSSVIGVARKTHQEKIKSTASSNGKRSADVFSPPSCSPKLKCLDTTALSKGYRKMTDFVKKMPPKEEMPPKICDFICDIISEPVKGIGHFRTVRGRVTKHGSLNKKDKSWDLKATITDYTASLDITFSSEVLEDMIGFSVAEFVAKKKLRKTNPEVEEFLRKGFRNAEARVQRMDALMEIELRENDVPKVVDIRELTEEHKQLIQKRVKLLAI
ncbi:recQ-mediated genome instability protein 1-like [Athalia rosae]|uniref:recQ-mediated genome instability protein 1-like n=1 Tax=Athalia rosae TaxID=37344 RepID=UPI002033E0C7|nr:recQ-mediated genome instability protein 1-like [Athalia rosae]XP_048506749.1 recQ-mediated genome instability protein 1-like [Athalia rosae]